MQCPVCQIELAMSDRQGVEIDYCPKCRGVWLDRGELDKIIERNAAPQVSTAAPRHLPEQREHDKYHEQKHPTHGHYRKKKSLLSELFDF